MKLDIKKILGQGDGGLNMDGKYRGVKARIRLHNFYLHTCIVHDTNKMYQFLKYICEMMRQSTMR